MRQGDFTKLAKHYVHRAGYSTTVLQALACYVGAFRDGFRVADVGAGTGKLTEQLIDLGLHGYAVEPNDAMREEGIRVCKDSALFVWLEGSAEATGLPDSSVDWVLMASSFHWTKQDLALAEFYRVLKPGGFFTALWNPRDLDRSELHQRIEKRIHEAVPELRRVSSGAPKYTQGLEDTLAAAEGFRNLLFLEAAHQVAMEKDRYMGAWRSVNDIQAQAGEARFQEILLAIESEIAELDQVVVPYRTRAWTIQSTKGQHATTWRSGL